MKENGERSNLLTATGKAKHGCSFILSKYFDPVFPKKLKTAHSPTHTNNIIKFLKAKRKNYEQPNYLNQTARKYNYHNVTTA